jgi:hypothetical protein
LNYKLLILLSVLFVGANSYSQSDLKSKIIDAASAIANSVDSSNASTRDLSRALALINKAQSYIGEGTGDRPVGLISLYGSDSCNGELVANLRSRTSCLDLPNNSVWGVKINGVCLDVDDTDAVTACKRFKGGLLSPSSPVLYNSDTCRDKAVAIIANRTDCDQLGIANVWGVKIGDQCINSEDTNVKTACINFKAAGERGPKLNIYRNDRCQGSLVAVASSRTVCSDLINFASAWGISDSQGQCQDISDTTIQQTCTSFAP